LFYGADAHGAVGPALERAPRFADLVELPLDEQAALDGFDRLSPSGRPLGAGISSPWSRGGWVERSGRADGGASRNPEGWGELRPIVQNYKSTNSIELIDESPRAR